MLESTSAASVARRCVATRIMFSHHSTGCRPLGRCVQNVGGGGKFNQWSPRKYSIELFGSVAARKGPRIMTGDSLARYEAPKAATLVRLPIQLSVLR